jgi:Cof subfamily protein (haloacid dehalogenase superfamily)
MWVFALKKLMIFVKMMVKSSRVAVGYAMSAKRFENILVCTDLDGTLLNEEREVSKENVDAIEYFKSEGGLFTFVTGRQKAITKEIYDTLKPNVPFACFNGPGLFDGEKNEFIRLVTLPDSAAEILDYVVEQFPQVGIQLNTKNGIYYQQDCIVTEAFRERTNTQYQYGTFKTVAEPVVKVIFASEDGACLDRVSEAVMKHPKAGEVDIIRSEYIFSDLMPKNVNKGDGLQALAEYLKIDMRNTLAIGDYDNDVSMIERAGVGVAVANASPNAKAAADRMTVSNNEHAIAKIIDDIDKGVIRFAR